MRLIKCTILMPILALVLMGTPGCEKKSDTEKAIDKAADATKDAAKKTGDAAKDAADKAKDAVK